MSGFGPVKDWNDWQDLDEAQREYETFRILKSVDGRMSAIERKPIVDKCFAFIGGVIGGLVAVFCGGKI